MTTKKTSVKPFDQEDKGSDLGLTLNVLSNLYNETQVNKDLIIIIIRDMIRARLNKDNARIKLTTLNSVAEKLGVNTVDLLPEEETFGCNLKGPITQNIQYVVNREAEKMGLTIAKWITDVSKAMKRPRSHIDRLVYQEQYVRSGKRTKIDTTLQSVYYISTLLDLKISDLLI